MKIPSIPQNNTQDMTTCAIIEAVEVLTGRRKNDDVNLGGSLGSYKISDMVNVINGMSGKIYYANSYASFSYAVNHIGATLIVSTEQVINKSITTPPTLDVVVIGGGRFTGSSGTKLTFGKFTVLGSPRQVFSGFDAGDVTGLSEARPEWWGAVGDANTTTRTGTDDTTAVQCAISSLTNGGMLLISKWHGIVGPANGTVNTKGLQTTVDNVTVFGIGKKLCGFVLIGTTYPGWVFSENNEAKCTGWEWYNVGFYGHASTALHSGSSASSSGIRMYYFQDLNIHDCEFFDFTVGAFYGGCGGNLSSGIRFERNLVKGINQVAYMGSGVSFARDIWFCDNIYENTALGVSLETYRSPDIGYDIYNFHIKNNTFRGITGATHSNTNAAICIQLQADTGNEIYGGEIIGNVCESIIEAAASTSGGPAMVSMIGSSANMGNIHDVVVHGNVLESITPDASTPTCYGHYYAYCKNISSMGNTIPEIATAGTSSYGMDITDCAYSTFVGNIIRGTGWTQPMVEWATIECNNTFLCNTTENGSSFAALGTSKSLVLQKNPLGARMDLLLDVFSARIGEDGKILLGTSNANFDTTLYRSEANSLKSDDDIITATDFQTVTAGKGVVLKNAAGTVTKRVRLNDAGDGLIFETP